MIRHSRKTPQLSFDPSIACLLEEIYAECNRPERLALDPLAVVKEYRNPADLEVAGLVCATLAFGSVTQIIRACRTALEPLGSHPAQMLADMNPEAMARAWGQFQYRFCFSRDMIALMGAIQKARKEFGSLEGLFMSCMERKENADLAGAATLFVRALRGYAGVLRQNLLPDPADGSACKRLFLFLRWMVRRDAIDPGPWTGVDLALLIVPMDTHMARTCRIRLGFLPDSAPSRLSSPNLADALQATAAFRLYAPHDPVKYDFALTRPGIDPQPGDARFGCL